MRYALGLFFIFNLYITSMSAQQIDTLSYSLGVNIANSLKSQGFEGLDVESLMKGFQDVLGPGEPMMTNEQAMQYIQSNMQKMAQKKHESVIEAGKKFLEENGKRPEVTTTASGLQYEVITPGTGTVNPKATSKVKVHYHGTLLDGTVFDSSVDRGEPISFGLNQVISGWTEGVQLMTEGGKYRFFIPYNLAYGERAAGDKIKPYSTLIFEVELLEIQ